MKIERNSALDFTRGILIIVMVLHHSLDQFPVAPFFHKNIRFITGAFIFVGGFIISNIYIKKYNIQESGIYIRLISRGLKLVLIFSILNVLMSSVLRRAFDGGQLGVSILLDNLFEIYLPGNQELIIYDILLPIGYLLIVAGILLLFTKERFRYAITIISFIVFTYCSIKYFSILGAYNFRYLTLGLFGIAIGFINTRTLENRLLKNIYAILFAYLIYELLLTKIEKFHYPVYVAGVFLNLILIYILGLKLRLKHIIANLIILIGNYSLLAYIAHVAIIVVVSRILIVKILQINNDFASFLILLMITTILTAAIVAAVDYCRRKIRFIDKLYRFVFS